MAVSGAIDTVSAQLREYKGNRAKVAGGNSRRLPRENKRRSPASPLAGSALVVPARPIDFFGWWRWGRDQAEASSNDPLKLHDRHRPPEPLPTSAHDDLGRRLTKPRDAIIMGQAYSVPFERYLERSIPRSPIHSAMVHLFNPRGWQSMEFRIVFALISGHTDHEVVRAILGGPSREYFEAATIRALLFVWERAEQELAAVVDPPAPAGAA